MHYDDFSLCEAVISILSRGLFLVVCFASLAEWCRWSRADASQDACNSNGVFSEYLPETSLTEYAHAALGLKNGERHFLRVQHIVSLDLSESQPCLHDRSSVLSMQFPISNDLSDAHDHIMLFLGVMSHTLCKHNWAVQPADWFAVESYRNSFKSIAVTACPTGAGFGDPSRNFKSQRPIRHFLPFQIGDQRWK